MPTTILLVRCFISAHIRKTSPILPSSYISQYAAMLVQASALLQPNQAPESMAAELQRVTMDRLMSEQPPIRRVKLANAAIGGQAGCSPGGLSRRPIAGV